MTRHIPRPDRFRPSRKYNCVLLACKPTAMTYVWGASSHHHHPYPLTPSPGISKNSIALELIEIFQFCLKIWSLWWLLHPWGLYSLVGGWMGGWVDGRVQVITLKILKMLTEPREFNSVWRFMICRDTPIHGWVWVCGWLGGWVCQWVGSGQMTKNLINLDLIEIFQFCLKIYDLRRHPHPWVCGWMGQWVNGWGQVKWLTIE